VFPFSWAPALLLHIFSLLLPLQLSYILYINLVSLSVSQSVEVLKLRSLLIKLSPRTWGLKNYSRPWVLTSYFYVCRAIIVVVDEGGIFGIWRMGENIWMRFFWAKGLEGSWFLFFSWRAGKSGVLRVLISESELEWEMRRTGWGIDRVHYAPRFTLVIITLEPCALIWV
jgi:hypothetical protein